MFRRAVITFAFLVFASFVLVTSVFSAIQPRYAFFGTSKAAEATVAGTPTIDYYLPYPGILPDHFLWPLKALRDRVWLFLTYDLMKRSEINLLLGDKRVRMAEELIKGGKVNLGVSTATKAEKYLEQAFLEQEKAAAKGVDTGQFLETLARSALKHQEVLEKLAELAPEDAKPQLNKTLDYPKRIYEQASHRLNEQGRPIPTF